MWKFSKLMRALFLMCLTCASPIFGFDASAGLGRPFIQPNLAPIANDDIALTERIVWGRDYNNFVDASDRCYDRAVDVIGELNDVELRRGHNVPLHLGADWSVSQSNVAKMMLVFPYVYAVPTANGGTVPSTRWAYHIATVVRGSDLKWHPVDPDRTGVSPGTPEEWVQRHAWDAWHRSLAVTRTAIGAYYQDLPPMGQVYFYWLPADYFQPSMDASRHWIQLMLTRDPIFGRAASVADLQSYRYQMKLLYPTLAMSSVDLF